MHIEIDYNGAFAVCKITGLGSDKLVSFNDADIKDQVYALSAFRCVKENWTREQKLKKLK